MKVLTAALLTVVTTALVVPAVAGGVETLHDADADFGSYATYEWMESKEVPAIPEIRRYLVHQIEAQLEAAGFKKVESGGDLKVGARVSTTTETSASMHYAGEVPWTVGYIWRGDRGINETSLIVDVIDAAANHAIWQGFADKTFYDQDRTNYGRLRKKIDKLISTMFHDFPPKPGSGSK